MMNSFKADSVGRVIEDYQAVYTDPLTISTGEELTIGERDSEWPGWIWCTNGAGKGGWVPERGIEQRGEVGVARYDYSAAELSVRVGEELTLHAEESGWFWATNRAGRSGWVPAKHIEGR